MGHETTNQKVVGSNPAGLTKEKPPFLKDGGFFMLKFTKTEHAIFDVFERFLTVLKQSKKQSTKPRPIVHQAGRCYSSGFFTMQS